MDSFKTMLFDLRYVVVVVVAIAIYATFAWSSFKTHAYALMLQAKSLAKDAVLKSGKQQEDWVCEKIYQFAPKAVTMFISNENMHVVIHYLFVEAKDYLDDGKLNKSIQ